MTKKNLPAFKPARLVEGTSRTYIALKYTTKSGEYIPGKPTYGLGKIWNVQQRRRRGNQLVDRINWWLEQGYYYIDFCEIQAAEGIRLELNTEVDEELSRKLKLRQTNVLEAIEIARTLKLSKTKKKSSINVVNSKCRILSKWLKDNGFDYLAVGQFSKNVITKYLFYYKTERKTSKGKPVSNTTYNNLILHNSAIWSELVDAEYLEKNPWSGQKKLPAEDKIRQPFEVEDAKVVLDYLIEKDILLYYACIIIYLTGIRPVELIGLKFKDINIKKKMIRVHGDFSKVNKFRWCTIPDDYINIFQRPFWGQDKEGLDSPSWENFPPNYYIFGEGLKPSPAKPAGKESLKTRHRNVIDFLYIDGKIINREGYQFYSWKDTGAGDIIDSLGVHVAQQQYGHKKITTTMRYKKKDVANKKMLTFKSEII